MHTVYKFLLKPVTEQIISMPANAQPLFVGAQDDDICLWAKVNTDEYEEERRVFIYGTGHRILDEGAWHVGSVVMNQGALVFHVFVASANR